MNKFIIVCTMLFMVQSVHANVNWNRTDGGALDVAENWSNAVKPDGTTGETWLYNQQSAPLTMPTDGSMTFGETRLMGLIGTFDLGSKSKTIKMSGLQVFEDSGRASATELVSGTISASGTVFVEGDNCSITLNGPDAVLTSAGVQIGVGKMNCAMSVLGGASYSGGTGNIMVGLNNRGTADALIVSGVGSTCSIKQLHVGAGSSNCVASVLDGGTLSTSEGIYIGRDNVNSTDVTTPRPGNMLVVSNATVTQASGILYVGMSSSSNRLEILDRGTVAAYNFRVGNDRRSEAEGKLHGNSAVVRGSGSRLTVSGDMYVGRLNSVDSEFTVADGATMDIKGDAYIGHEANVSGSKFTVDNAVFDYAPPSAKNFIIGNYARDASLNIVNGGRFFVTNSTATLKMGSDTSQSASNSIIRVSSGGMFRGKSLQTGGQASSAIVVEDGDVEFSGTLYLRNYATLLVKGSNSYVNASTINVNRPDGKPTFRVEIPPEGLVGERPLVHTANLYPFTMASTMLVVDVAEPADSVTANKTYVIFKVESGSAWSAYDLYARTQLVGYDRAALDYDDARGEILLMVRPKSKGLLISFK